LTTNAGLGPEVYISGQEFPNKTPGNNSPKACSPGRETLWMDSKTQKLALRLEDGEHQLTHHR